MILRKSAARLLPVAAVIVALAHAAALSAVTREAQVKAAYIYKLVPFVRWPPEAHPTPTSPTRLCIFGRVDVLGVIGRLVRSQVAGLPRVEAVSVGSGGATSGCHALYLGEGGAAGRALLQQTSGTPVLTITDRSAGSLGGVIELVERGDKVRLIIHQSEAERRRLILSSKLLMAAEAVEP